MPGVSVTMMPESGGPVSSTVTAADGSYRFESVADGDYRIDFELRSFDVARRNHVRVRNGTAPAVDATMLQSSTCQCVLVTGLGRLVERSGQVVDAAGRPLPRARIAMTITLPPDPEPPPAGRETWVEAKYTDKDGRFSVRGPVDQRWQMTASDTGFASVTESVSGFDAGPIVFRLSFAGTTGVPDSERLRLGCRCDTNLFTHPDR